MATGSTLVAIIATMYDIIFILESKAFILPDTRFSHTKKLCLYILWLCGALLFSDFKNTYTYLNFDFRPQLQIILEIYHFQVSGSRDQQALFYV